MLMKKQFQSKSVPRGTRTIWRYLGALFLLFTLGIGNVWAADPIENVGTYSTQVISADRTTSTWTFITPGSQVTIPTSPAETEDNDIIFHPGGGSKMKFSSSNGFSWLGNSDGYIPVPSGAAGSISMTVKGASDSRWLQLYVAGESAGSTKRLWSKEANPATEARGPRTFTFTSSDLTTKGGKTYLHLRDNNSELKIATITVTLTTGTYGSSTPDETAPTLSGSVPANSATDVAVEGTIVLTFSEAIAKVDGSKFTLDGATKGTVAIDGTDSKKVNVAYSGAANEATVTLSVAAAAVEDAAGNKSAALSAISFTTVAAVTPACPSGLSISGTKDYTAGQTISLEAALEAGNGEITYNWYKGDDLATAKAAGSIGTGASFSKASCATSDAGNYWCVASKDGCLTDAESAAYAVTVAAAIDPWIIKVALSGDISSATKTMSGSIGGDAAYSGLQNSSAPYKIGGNSAYLNLTLATGYFYPGDSVVLDLSKTGQMFYGATDNDADHLLGTTTAKDGIHYFILPASFPANTNTIHVGRTSSTYNGTLSYMAVYRTPICPQTLTISGETDYVPGDKIELTASLAKGNGAITYQWYKGGTAEGDKLTGKTNAKLEIEDCVAGDAGDYYCIASKEDCSDAVNAAAYTITVNDFVAVTGITISPASPTVAAKSKITLTAEVAPVEATNKVVEWSVKAGSEAYASVNATTGEVTGKAAGNAVIVATATDGSGVFAEKTVVVTPFVCPTSGTMFSLACTASASAKAAKNGGVLNCGDYATEVNGAAQIVNNSSSDQESVTSSGEFKLTGFTHYMKIELDCELAEGDSIILDNSAKFIILKAPISQASDTAGVDYLYYSGSSVHKAVCGEAWDGVDEIYISYLGSSLKFKNVSIVRPAKYAVTFNMHGHGDAVDAQNIIKGGKVTNPGTPSASGWDFGGWYKTYVADPESYTNPWDFDNDVVSAVTEIHAKWTEHVLSNNVALGTLTVNGEDVTIVPSQLVYAVELPFGTTAIPTVAATAADANAKACNVTQASAVDGSATIYVKAEDNTEANYTINFSVATSKDIELVWDKSKERCDATKPDANVLIAAMSEYLSASYTGSAAEGGSLNTGKTTGSKIIITAKPGYAFKAMGFYGKIEDGTCNFYNDGVVETIGTSTGDACYANVFSNDEVHEFVIELTGSNGVYIRNMQLTIIKACTPITLAWDEEPVEFEVGKSGYAIAATASNGGTVSYSTTASEVVDVVAATGALTISGLGSATLKAATAEGDGTTYCANGGNDIEISKAVNTYYLVKFDAQNGDAADEVKYYYGDAAIALPADPTFAGYDFQGWFDAETGGNKYTAAITPAASITVYAQWVAQCAGATITTQPTGASYLTGRTATALVCEATAGAGGALTYEWFTCDDALKTNPVAATAMPSTAVAGTFYYFCKVTEAGCDVEAFSDVVTITVADKDPICLIATTVTGATAHGDVTGFLGADRGGDAEVNVTGGSYKMDKGKYIGVTLPDGYKFQEGDKVVLNVMTVNNATGFTLFDGKEGEKNLIIDTRDGALVPAGENTVVLPAYAGSQSVYVLRENNNTTGDLNSALDAVAVYRTSAPFVHKVTVAGVDGTPDNTNHIAIEVPFSTTDDALDAIVYDWVSNNDAWTAAHAPAVANTWEWGVENTVTFADKDGDESVYYITISKAVASSDATLATLTYGGTAIALADGVYEYDVELPYGTSAVPALAATAHHAGANVTDIDDAAAFVNRQATSTVTVTAEDNTELVYTVNFTVSRFESKVLWDGSTMTQMSDITAAATAAGVTVTTTGISVSSFSAKTCEENGKSYTKALDFGGKTQSSRNFGIEIPAGKVAKVSVVYRAKSTSRSIMIATALSDAVNESTITSKEAVDGSNLYIMTADMFGGGTLYINTTDGYHVHEIDLQLADGHARSAMLGAGVYGTVCVPNNVAIEDIQGVTVYELMGREPQYGKLAFDEIISGELEAGVPYVFQAHGNHMALLYGEDHVANPVDKGNGMYGTFSNITLPDEDLGVNDLSDIYYFAQKALWSCDGAVDLTVGANRAYVKLSEVGNLSDPNPAPGRRRVTMNVNGEKVATGMDNLNASEQPVKLLINGQIFILRGEKLFDATGKLVK